MRRVFVTNAPISSEVMAEALAYGATEIVHAPHGVPPSALAGLAMGYHEIPTPGDETEG